MRPCGLLLLCGYLAVWVPLNAAALGSRSLPSLDTRGASALLELGVHVASAAICFAAGWMLWRRSPAGVPLAVAALCVQAAVTIQAAYVSALPRDVRPGVAGPLTVFTLLFTTVWLLYLRRSRRLHAWLE